jgi:hypothetical protein
MVTLDELLRWREALNRRIEDTRRSYSSPASRVARDGLEFQLRYAERCIEAHIARVPQPKQCWWAWMKLN